MAFIARRPGTCSRCKLAFIVGVDYVAWSRLDGQTWHLSCPKTEEKTMTPVIEIETPKQEIGNGNGNGNSANVEHALKTLMSALTPTVKLDETLVRSIVVEEVKKQVRTIEIKQDQSEPVVLSSVHKDFDTLLKLSSTFGANGHRLNVYMHGPAGSGKSTAAKQVADALKLSYAFASLNPQTPDSKLMGFIHAGGHYVPGLLFKAYTEGGILCLDEIDNASASFVTTLNSALENGHASFPHGVFARHKDFICICTANTIGRGGDVQYPERRQLDGAFLERFYFLEWSYDHALTRSIVAGILGDEADMFIEWVKEKGENLKAKYPTLIVSPRAYIQGATLKKIGFKGPFIVDSVIARGIK